MLILEHIIFSKVLSRLSVFMCHIYAVFFILIGWVIFRSENLSQMIEYIVHMFLPYSNDINCTLLVINREYIVVLIFALFFAIPQNKIIARINNNKYCVYILDFLLILFFIVAISYMLGRGYSPFLYFRF